mmetsp:Transcript_32104/g.80019  ORF Transcript_32104/g.80019 Transcript_32104/m.80019 type:complete len:339 (+) Transcript_32104:4041-5057(+)
MQLQPRAVDESHDGGGGELEEVREGAVFERDTRPVDELKGSEPLNRRSLDHNVLNLHTRPPRRADDKGRGRRRRGDEAEAVSRDGDRIVHQLACPRSDGDRARRRHSAVVRGDLESIHVDGGAGGVGEHVQVARIRCHLRGLVAVPAVEQQLRADLHCLQAVEQGAVEAGQANVDAVVLAVERERGVLGGVRLAPDQLQVALHDKAALELHKAEDLDGRLLLERPVRQPPVPAAPVASGRREGENGRSVSVRDDEVARLSCIAGRVRDLPLRGRNVAAVRRVQHKRRLLRPQHVDGGVARLGGGRDGDGGGVLAAHAQEPALHNGSLLKGHGSFEDGI